MRRTTAALGLTLGLFCGCDLQQQQTATTQQQQQQPDQQQKALQQALPQGPGLTAVFSGTTAGAWVNFDGVVVALSPSLPPSGVTGGTWFRGNAAVKWIGPGFGNNVPPMAVDVTVGKTQAGTWTAIVRCANAIEVNFGSPQPQAGGGPAQAPPLVFPLPIGAPPRVPTHMTTMTVS